MTLFPNGAGADEAPVFNLIAHLKHQIAFSRETFGPGARTKGVLAHIRKELLEIEAQPTDLEEWVDLLILALDGATRMLAEEKPYLSDERIAQNITDMLVFKQIKNENRNWPDWRTRSQDEPIEHIKGEPR